MSSVPLQRQTPTEQRGAVFSGDDALYLCPSALSHTSNWHHTLLCLLLAHIWRWVENTSSDWCSYSSSSQLAPFWGLVQNTPSD